jgi:hypothetical protein
VSLRSRVATWFAYLWCAVLVIQNAAITSQVMQIPTPEARSYLWWAVAKMFVLCVAVLAFIRHRGRLTLMILSAAIVLAFPIGTLVQRELEGAPIPFGLLVSLSALLSYVAALALLIAHRQLLTSAARR